jgi:hypothetical protein
VSDLRSSSTGKKPYHRPTCTLKSIHEAGLRLCKKASEQGSRLGANEVRPPTAVPVLLVEGFEADLGFIEQTTRTRALPLEPPSLLKGGGLMEMQFTCQQESAPSETFLLLDLRNRRQGERGLLDSIGGIPTPGEFIPHVILVSSMEEFHDWRGIEATHCWQLRGGPSAAELAAALRSFMHLCSFLANQWPQGRPAVENYEKYALEGKTYRE